VRRTEAETCMSEDARKEERKLWLLSGRAAGWLVEVAL
jgi:hypothetical protein